MTDIPPHEDGVSLVEEVSAVESAEPSKSPALTIVIQSWATPLVGLLMLVIGLLGGYWGRPVVTGLLATPAPTSAPSVAVTQPAPADTAGNAELMELVVSQTNHFLGDENAPVTLIEFSDFQ